MNDNKTSRLRLAYGFAGGLLTSAIVTGAVAAACNDRNILIPGFIECALTLIAAGMAVTRREPRAEPFQKKADLK